MCDSAYDFIIVIGSGRLIAARFAAQLGATIVTGRAGETIAEFAIALKNNPKVGNLAGAIRAYPACSTAVQQLSAGIAIENFLSSTSGKVIRDLSKLVR